MKKENIFYLIILLTILISRISIIIVPEVDIKIFDIVIHHFWFGIVLLIIGFIISNEKMYFKIFLYGIGAGLVIDQSTFMILGAGKDKEYWALPSLLGTLIITFVIYPVRSKLINYLLKICF